MTVLCFATRKRNEAWNPGNFGCRGLLVYAHRNSSALKTRLDPNARFRPIADISGALLRKAPLQRLGKESKVQSNYSGRVDQSVGEDSCPKTPARGKCALHRARTVRPRLVQTH